MLRVQIFLFDMCPYIIKEIMFYVHFNYFNLKLANSLGITL